MRHSHNTPRLATAAVLAGGAVGLLAGPGTASAVVPGSNGLIAVSKCEDGPTTCNVSHIWTVDPSSGAEHQVTSGASNWDADPAFSPDGTRIAFQRCPANAKCRISVVDAAGGAVTDLTPGTYDDDFPTFSPDGTEVVFSREDPVAGKHLVVIDVAGGNERLLTNDTSYDNLPSWSPDGSTVVFQRSPSGVPDYRIYKVAASGGTPVQLTDGPSDYAPSFSPDGSQIAFTGGGAIELMDANGGNRHTLTSPPADRKDDVAAFSPDGTQIVFNRWAFNTTNANPLMVMNLDGSNLHAITDLSEKLYRPAWQPLHAAPSPSGSPAAPADTTAPVLTLRAPKRESVRKGRLYVFATSNEAGSGSTTGGAAIRHRAKRYRLGSSTRGVAAGARAKVSVKIPRKSLRAIRAALVRHERATATIAVTVRDGAGNATRKAVRIRLDK